MSKLPQATERIGDWVGTWSGVKFYPFDPRPEEVELEDLAHHLAGICRFTGGTSRHYSVAEHSYWVSHYCDPRDAFAGLLHDGHEYITHDLSSPIKHDPSMMAYELLASTIQAAVYERFGLPNREPASVHRIDHLLLLVEGRQLKKPGSISCTGRMRQAGETSDPSQIRGTPLERLVLPCWDRRWAKEKFLQRFHELDSLR
jgi:hypothetical protein